MIILSFFYIWLCIRHESPYVYQYFQQKSWFCKLSTITTRLPMSFHCTLKCLLNPCLCFQQRCRFAVVKTKPWWTPLYCASELLLRKNKISYPHSSTFTLNFQLCYGKDNKAFYNSVEPSTKKTLKTNPRMVGEDIL